MPRALRLALLVAIGLLLLADLLALTNAGAPAVRLLSGGATRWSLRATDSPGQPLSDDEAAQIESTLKSRLDQLDVRAAVVERVPGEIDLVHVIVPPLEAPERVQRLLLSEARLELRLAAPSTSAGPPYANAEVAEQAVASLPGGDGYEVVRASPDGAASWIALERLPVVTGRDLKTATARRSELGDGSYEIEFSLDETGAERLGRATAANVGRQLAIVIDGEVRSTPLILSRITDRGRISGDFGRREAEDLALVLRAGALPRPLTLVALEPAPARRLVKPLVRAAGPGLLALVGLAAALFFLARAD